MAKQDKSKLKDWFTTGKYPTQEQFWDWMDSYIHRDDQLRITANFPELDGVLQQKVDKEVFKHHFENDNNPHQVTKQQVGLGSVDNTMDIDKPVSMATQTALDLKADKTAMADHLKDDTNPHKVTKQQVGLGKADNTADLDKPVSRETQTALYLKADRADLSHHLMNDTNPHQVTKVQVGLGHADDTADVNKPISTATQTALDLKADKTYVNEQVSSLVNGAPELLDTLKELSAAIGDDANFAATLSTKLGNKLDKTVPLAGEVGGDYTNVVLNETAVTSKALTNLVIPKIADPIVATDKLIDALGKLQGQINIASDQIETSQKKIDNRIFSSQKKIETTISRAESGSKEIVSETAPAGILSTNGLARLHAILQFGAVPPRVNIPEFSTNTEVFLQIINGSFLRRYVNGEKKLFSNLKIADISSTKWVNWYLRELDLPILTFCSDSKKPYENSNLYITGINNIDGVKSEFYESVWLRNNTDTDHIGANEASFRIVVKSSLLPIKSENTVSKDILLEPKIRSFTLSRIN